MAEVEISKKALIKYLPVELDIYKAKTGDFTAILKGGKIYSVKNGIMYFIKAINLIRNKEAIPLKPFVITQDIKSLKKKK